MRKTLAIAAAALFTLGAAACGDDNKDSPGTGGGDTTGDTTGDTGGGDTTGDTMMETTVPGS
ncbi:MAG: hypothetical protein WKF45_04910 [Ilumatobacteraceae bacterium]